MRRDLQDPFRASITLGLIALLLKLAATRVPTGAMGVDFCGNIMLAITVGIFITGVIRWLMYR